jgi:NDP-sugar pyrophosphorylase family protein
LSGQISRDCIIGESTRVAERALVKSSVVGKHCKIGAHVRLNNCIVMDYVNIDEKYASLLNHTLAIFVIVAHDFILCFGFNLLIFQISVWIAAGACSITA